MTDSPTTPTPDPNPDEQPEKLSEADGTHHFFRALGKQLKRLRDHAGMSQRDLAQATFCSEDLISAMERAVRTPQPDFLMHADKLLDAHGLLIVAIEDVKAAQAKARVRHPNWRRDYAQLEPRPARFTPTAA